MGRVTDGDASISHDAVLAWLRG
ncbi:MAG: hypothetical protein QOH30_3117, partial [Baekduia sp.]|nr:hypothetical protein [Baekduia sp.]